MSLVHRSSVLALGLMGLIVGATCSENGAHAQATDKPVVTVTTGHSMSVVTMAFSPDGRRMVTGSYEAIKVWELKTGRMLRTMTGHSSLIEAIAVSPDGRRIVSSGADKVLNYWDAETGNRLRSVKQDGYGHVVFSRDGKSILADGSDSVVRLDPASGRNLQTYRMPADFRGMTSLAASPDERLIAGGEGAVKGRDSLISLWDAASGRIARSWKAHGSVIKGLSFSPDGRLLASGSYDNSIKLWDTASGRLVRTLAGHTNGVYAVAFSPDGRMLASGDGNGTFRLWDPATGRLLATHSEGKATINALAFSPDGRSIAAAEDDNSIKIRDTDRGTVLAVLQGPAGYYENASVTFTPDGNWLVSGATGLSSWNISNGQLARTLAQQAELLSPVVVTPDGRWLMASTDQKVVKLWNVVTGELIRTIPFAKSADDHIYSAKLSPDGRWIAAGVGDGNTYDVMIWDAHTAALVKSFGRGGKLITDVAFSPNGRELVVAMGTAQAAVVIQVETWQPLRAFKTGDLRLLAFSSDGRWLATDGHEATTEDPLKLFEYAAGRLSRSYRHGGFNLNAIAISPDGRLLVSAGGLNNVINLWEASSGRLISPLVGSPASGKSITFSPDSKYVVAANANGTIVVWSAQTGQLLTTTVHATSGEWVTITPEGFFASSEKGAELIHIARSFETTGIDQVYQSLYRPDLVREKLAGDTRGLVREAAAKLDLTKVLASGNAPVVTMVSPRDGTRATAEQVTAEVEISERGGGVGRVEWRVNGVTVAVEAAPAGQPLRLTRGLVLDDGENELEVVAYNAANLVASVPARATVTGQVTTAASTPARMFVLAVGLNEYAEAKFKLTYAVPDAKAIAAALIEAGKGIYESVEVTLVQDADVKRGKLDAVFTDLATKVRPSDVFVFFLGGHGKTVDGRYYFIPQDFAIEGSVTKTALESAVVKQGIAQEQWQAWLARIPAKKSVLLFDTCESGSLTGEGKETRALERGAANDRLVQATGRTILTASSDDTDAFEGFRGHGLFTYNVLEALERADSDGNGRIEVAELAAYVYAQVTALSEQVFKQRQVPQVRITGNYSLAKPTQIFAGKEPGIVLPGKATHQVTAAAELLVLPAMGARRVRKLDAKTPVTLVKSDAGWTLIAREGRPLGFVATKDLAPIP